MKKLTYKLSVSVIVLFAFIFFACHTPVSKTPEKKDNPNGRNDSWGFVGAGGGGAMFNPAVSPHNPDFAFVSCDMGGSFATYNGGDSWRMFHLHGMTKFYAFDPLDTNVVYANSLGLFKSTDNGNTWKLLYPDLTEIDGVVSKGDHGDELIVTKDSTIRKVLAMAVDPANSAKLYAAISINNVTSFFVSDNGGKQWNPEKELRSGIKNIFIDPSSPKDNRTVFVAGSSGISQRVNGVWNDTENPKDVASLTTFSGGYDEQNKKFIIYSISGKSYFHPEDDNSGIYFTDNGGLTWENRQDGLVAFNIKDAALPEWRTIATSTFQPNVVYVSYSGLKIHNDTTCIGVAKSTDFGMTWKLVWKDVQTKDSYTPSANFDKDWLTDRFGPGWGENPFGIGVSPTNPEICFTTDFGRTIKTSNGGETWESVYSRYNEGGGWTSRGLEVTTGYSIVFDPFDEKHVFIPTTDIGLMESTDGTQTWMSATKNNGIPEKWVNTTYWLTFDKEVKGKAWAVMCQNHDLPRPKMFRKQGVGYFTGGILMTENAGKTWQPVSSTIGEAAMTHILYDPTSDKQSRSLYACAFGKGVYKSVDGGKSWVQKNNGIAGAEPFAWQITRRETDGALFLVVSRRSDNGSIGDDKDGALYKSVDGAESWTKLPIPEGTNAPTTVVVDKKNPEKIIMSAWGRITQGRFSPDTGGGIFVSEDEGKSWKQVMSKDQHIGAVTFDERNNRYYANGFEGSAYYSEDGANTWNRIKGYNFKWGQRVEPDPFNPDMIYIITFGGGVWHGPAKGDDTALEDIVPRLDRLN